MLVGEWEAWKAAPESADVLAGMREMGYEWRWDPVQRAKGSGYAVAHRPMGLGFRRFKTLPELVAFREGWNASNWHRLDPARRAVAVAEAERAYQARTNGPAKPQ